MAWIASDVLNAIDSPLLLVYANLSELISLVKVRALLYNHSGKRSATPDTDHSLPSHLAMDYKMEEDPVMSVTLAKQVLDDSLYGLARAYARVIYSLPTHTPVNSTTRSSCKHPGTMTDQ